MRSQNNKMCAVSTLERYFATLYLFHAPTRGGGVSAEFPCALTLRRENRCDCDLRFWCAQGETEPLSFPVFFLQSLRGVQGRDFCKVSQESLLNQGKQTHPQKTPTPINPTENSLNKQFPQFFLRGSCFIERKEGGQFARTVPIVVYTNSFHWGGWFLGWVSLIEEVQNME